MSLGSFFSGIVGAVVGFVVSGFNPVGALYGFQAGMLAGTVLFPDKLPAVYGPRLEDAQTTTASVGDPIARVWGTAAVGGTVIFLGTLTETVTKRKIGKWPAKQTVYDYSYDQTIAIGLCEGPIAGLSRIWENGILVYDTRAQLNGETDAEYSERVAASAKYASTFVLYLGTETQTADPTLDDEAGAGGVPGYRGLAYVVYPRRALTDAQGRRHPTWRFEVISSGALTCTTTTEFTTEWVPPWDVNGLSLTDPRDPRFLDRYQYYSFTYAGASYSATPYDTLEEARAATTGAGGTPVLSTLWGWSMAAGFNAQSGIYPVRPVSPYDTGGFPIPDNIFDRDRQFHYNTRAGSGYYDVAWYTNPSTVDFTDHLAGHEGQYYTGRTINVGAGNQENNTIHGIVYQKTNGTYDRWGSMAVRVRRVPQAPADVSELYPAAPTAGYYINDDGDYVKQTEWTLVSGTFRALSPAALAIGGFQYTRIPLGPVLPSTDPNYSVQAWWEPYRDAAIAEGTLPASPGTFGTANNWGTVQNFAYTRDLTVCTVAGGQVSLATIITDLCAEAGLTAVDTTDLESTYVKGFVRGNLMTARSAIESLRPVGLFDCVESSFTLKFPTRGKASVRTLSTTDLAAYAEGEQIPSGVETRKLQDPELPRVLRVTYSSYARDYEVGEQRSPTRLNSTAVNEPTVTIPAVLEDQQAARAAEIAWAESWVSRWVHNFSLDASHLDLEVGDAVTLPVDGRNTRVRITAIDDRIVGVRQIEAVRDEISAYTSTAAGTTPGTLPPNKMQILGTPYLELLDLPYFGAADPRAANGNADVLALVRQVGGNAWYGSMIGTGTTEADFDVQTTVYRAPVYGSVVAAAGSGLTTILDMAGELTVDLAKSTDTLATITEAELYAGGNLCAVGINNRWEVLQFLTATQVSTTPNRWTVSGLARGRRGTEWAVGTGVAGDRFVMLTPRGYLGVLPLTTDAIGQARDYLVLNIEANREANVDDGTTLGFATQGVLLKPYSVADIRGSVDNDDDWMITWSRRDRVATELASSGMFALSESSESYEVEILDGTDVVRTLTSTTPTVVYVASSQTTDFGSPQTSLTVRIYQMSSVVGRGYAATETLTA